jgi:tryptophan synthase alpha chain
MVFNSQFSILNSQFSILNSQFPIPKANSMNTQHPRIARAFARMPAFMPYFTLGYPDFETSLDIIAACCENGADLMELGIPFSDPLADGPTIQHSTQAALENGMTVARCLDAVRQLRARGVTTPFVLMGYVNPILAYGMEKFVNDAADAGADGFIVPDLPPEEAGDLLEFARGRGMPVSFLLAPNSPPRRIALAIEKSSGFIYLVSVMGITGARGELPSHLAGFAARVRASLRTPLPLAVGFGISTGAQAHAVGQIADGVIVGSALIKAVTHALDTGAAPVAAAGAFVREMRAALH